MLAALLGDSLASGQGVPCRLHRGGRDLDAFGKCRSSWLWSKPLEGRRLFNCLLPPFFCGSHFGTSAIDFPGSRSERGVGRFFLSLELCHTSESSQLALDRGQSLRG
jgi:hypothetical protein